MNLFFGYLNLESFFNAMAAKVTSAYKYKTHLSPFAAKPSNVNQSFKIEIWYKIGWLIQITK